MSKQKISGSDALILSLLEEGVTTIFGYPGGQIIPVFDRLYDYKDRLHHILVRHEQGATHAAQGYARVSGKVGVALFTSGPAATNAITGLADAMMDSTPIVVITGQVPSSMLGTDAFQETDVMGITLPITKWAYQIRRPEEIAGAVARAFYIARTGRPGPVVLDLTKDAQVGLTEFAYKKCNYIRSYTPVPKIEESQIDKAAELINQAKKPLMLIGQGVVLGNAEKEAMAVAEKTGIPMAATLLGLSAIPSDYPLYKGMLGMHGNIGPNIKTNECDVLIAVGMRFDDRVTGDLNSYAKQAKIIHFDIDASEFNKNVKVDVTVLGDAKQSLTALLDKVNPNNHQAWIDSFTPCEQTELEKVIIPEIAPQSGLLKMGEVVRRVSEASGNKAILVTDVGQNQMFGARYFKFTQTRSIVTSGGLGTMGFGLPAAIGAKFAAPERTVCLFCGDGGLQMTIQELGTILETGVGVKIILLNNNYLGMVRQWQQLFFHQRYSETSMVNPDFVVLASAYGIKSRRVEKREELDAAIAEMLSDDAPFLLDVCVEEAGLVFPMVPAGGCVSDIMLNPSEKY
ncbi:MAG TPA: biosynthetic-type acetolactate synthase large subunit [Candidatus Gallibacteroides avistercoris]|uniref:Acetolactate synthase n=1 Tax=Candidatus Gallibacteroides avistercoris TaxID=2840833 RepID=A0A9D1M7F8_9BACT|nr:biosynthetic-type acetolactate synthase large subunit [Candidatus Gallibacteroides avistercoris]